MVRPGRRGTRERLEDIRAAAGDALAFAGELDEAAFAVLADLSRIDTLVTDRTPDGDLARALADADVAVVVAPRA